MFLINGISLKQNMRQGENIKIKLLFYNTIYEKNSSLYKAITRSFFGVCS